MEKERVCDANQTAEASSKTLPCPAQNLTPMKKFLLYISERYSIPIGKPLQAEIERRGWQVRWFCDTPETKTFLSSKEITLENVEDVMAFNPDVVLCSTNIVPDFFPGIKVQIFHGFSVGKRSRAKGHFNIRGFFDLYCTQGPSTTLPFQQLQRQHRHFNVIETGWSKVDPLFTLQNAPRSHTRPTVMITSTFTPRLSLAHNPEAVETIARLARSGAWKFIAVLHPKMERDIVTRFKALQSEHFTFYDTTDLTALYRQADVMFSDTTSAISEFLLQNKPVVALNNATAAPYLINITTPQDLEQALKTALNPPQELLVHMQHFMEQTHPYRDGISSRRVVDACIKTLEHPPLQRKPLNLFRKYTIRKKLGYFPFMERLKQWWLSLRCQQCP